MGDEKQARHVLAEMQTRLARSPYDALALPAGDVSPEQVRTAFLELAKTFHPQKFARMSTEVYKLANEVFLQLRAAHDQLAKPKPNPARQSQQLPQLTRPLDRAASGTNSNRPATGGNPAVRPNAPPPNAPPPASSINPPTQRGFAPNPATTTGPRPAVTARQGTQPIQRRATPPGGVPAVTPPSGPRPAVRPSTPGGGVPRTAAPAPRAKVEPELVAVYDFFERGEYDRARSTLTRMIELDPRPRYQALLHYTQAREAQRENNLRIAQIEINDALTIDPDLQIAKDALPELIGRRK